MEMICVVLVEEHTTKELGDGNFASRFLQVSVVTEV